MMYKYKNILKPKINIFIYKYQIDLTTLRGLKITFLFSLQKYLRIFQHKGCRISIFYYELVIQGGQYYLFKPMLFLKCRFPLNKCLIVYKYQIDLTTLKGSKITFLFSLQNICGFFSIKDVEFQFFIMNSLFRGIKTIF